MYETRKSRYWLAIKLLRRRMARYIYGARFRRKFDTRSTPNAPYQTTNQMGAQLAHLLGERDGDDRIRFEKVEPTTTHEHVQLWLQNMFNANANALEYRRFATDVAESKGGKIVKSAYLGTADRSVLPDLSKFLASVSGLIYLSEIAVNSKVTERELEEAFEKVLQELEFARRIRARLEIFRPWRRREIRALAGKIATLLDAQLRLHDIDGYVRTEDSKRSSTVYVVGNIQGVVVSIRVSDHRGEFRPNTENSVHADVSLYGRTGWRTTDEAIVEHVWQNILQRLK